MDKWFAKSKTIWGLVIAFLVTILPEMGISFTEDDGALFTSMFDMVLEVISLGFAAYGRFVATEPLTINKAE